MELGVSDVNFGLNVNSPSFFGNVKSLIDSDEKAVLAKDDKFRSYCYPAIGKNVILHNFLETLTTKNAIATACLFQLGIENRFDLFELLKMPDWPLLVPINAFQPLLLIENVRPNTSYKKAYLYMLELSGGPPADNIQPFERENFGIIMQYAHNIHQGYLTGNMQMVVDGLCLDRNHAEIAERTLWDGRHALFKFARDLWKKDLLPPAPTVSPSSFSFSFPSSFPSSSTSSISSSASSTFSRQELERGYYISGGYLKNVPRQSQPPFAD